MDFLINFLIYIFTSKKLKKLRDSGEYAPKGEATYFVPFDETGIRGTHKPRHPGEGKCGGGEDYFSDNGDGIDGF